MKGVRKGSQSVRKKSRWQGSGEQICEWGFSVAKINK